MGVWRLQLDGLLGRSGDLDVELAEVGEHRRAEVREHGAAGVQLGSAGFSSR